MEETMLTTAEAADVLGVSPDTLKRWHKLGLILIEPFRTPGGHFRWPEGPVRRLKENETIRLAAEVDQRSREGQ